MRLVPLAIGLFGLLSALPAAAAFKLDPRKKPSSLAKDLFDHGNPRLAAAQLKAEAAQCEAARRPDDIADLCMVLWAMAAVSVDRTGASAEAEVLAQRVVVVRVSGATRQGMSVERAESNTIVPCSLILIEAAMRRGQIAEAERLFAGLRRWFVVPGCQNSACITVRMRYAVFLAEQGKLVQALTLADEAMATTLDLGMQFEGLDRERWHRDASRVFRTKVRVGWATSRLKAS